jgi:hypothetical protein
MEKNDAFDFNVKQAKEQLASCKASISGLLSSSCPNFSKIADTARQAAEVEARLIGLLEAAILLGEPVQG